MSTEFHPAWCRCRRCRQPLPGEAHRLVRQRVSVAGAGAALVALLALAMLAF